MQKDKVYEGGFYDGACVLRKQRMGMTFQEVVGME